MNKKYIVKLSYEERERLEELTSQGSSKARSIRRARVLLMSDDGFDDQFIALANRCSCDSVERTRKRCVLEGIDAALNEKPRPGAARKMTGNEEAAIIALACSNPPEGRTRWTMRLLADKAVEIIEHESISYETVRRLLKKTNLSPG
jgi:transposase